MCNVLGSSVLVTGAGGFVGSVLLAELTQRGIPVRGVVNRICSPSAGNDLICLGDIGPTTDWMNALQGINTVVHLAARVHVMHDTTADPLAAFRTVNVDGTLNLALQAAVAGVRRFVFVSSVKVNGEKTRPGQPFTEADPPSPQDAYARSKYEAEQGLRQIAANTAMEVVIIRPPLVYGPGVKANFAALLKAVQRGWPLPLGMIPNRRSLVALDNLVDFIVTCMSHPQAANRTFLVADGQDMSTTNLARGLANAARVSGNLWPIPVWMLRAGASLIGKSNAMQRLCDNLQVDISKARTLLGWVPPLSVAQGLERVVNGDVPQRSVSNEATQGDQATGH